MINNGLLKTNEICKNDRNKFYHQQHLISQRQQQGVDLLWRCGFGLVYLNLWYVLELSIIFVY